jgi:TfoX/Sxy family transcriptional regulator of competence genes
MREARERTVKCAIDSAARHLGREDAPSSAIDAIRSSVLLVALHAAPAGHQHRRAAGRYRVPYDERLAERVRLVVKKRRGVSEKKMFGGIAFLLRGNMFCGVVEQQLMVRVGPDAYAQTLARAHAREMDFTGRPLKGMVYVEPAGVRSPEHLRSWIDRGLQFVKTLPPK